MTREEAIKHITTWIYTLDDMPPKQVIEALQIACDALHPVSREQLSKFKTCELVDELRKREGVKTHIAEPYQDVTVSINGPAVVLVVID